MTPARATLAKLRDLYHTAWSRDWPEGNEFLTERSHEFTPEPTP